jgi:hypothetical protein
MTLYKFCLFFSIFLLLTEIKSKTNIKCEEDANCPEWYFCETYLKDKAIQKFCAHQPFRVSTKELLGMFGIMIGSALSNAGGIGGGGLLIPILLLMLKFDIHEAVPISKLMIFTGALTSFILGFKQRHPTRNAVTIDFNIPFLIVPGLLFGTMVGVPLNKVLPSLVILIALTLCLVVNTYKTLQKGKSVYKKENTERNVMTSSSISAMGKNGNNYHQLGDDSIKNSKNQVEDFKSKNYIYF